MNGISLFQFAFLLSWRTRNSFWGQQGSLIPLHSLHTWWRKREAWCWGSRDPGLEQGFFTEGSSTDEHQNRRLNSKRDRPASWQREGTRERDRIRTLKSERWARTKHTGKSGKGPKPLPENKEVVCSRRLQREHDQSWSSWAARKGE